MTFAVTTSQHNWKPVGDFGLTYQIALFNRHPRWEHSRLDRNVSSCNKGDPSEQPGIDLQWIFPLAGHEDLRPARKYPPISTPQNNNATFMAEDKSLGFSLTLLVVFFIIVAHLCKIGSSQLCY